MLSLHSYFGIRLHARETPTLLAGLTHIDRIHPALMIAEVFRPRNPQAPQCLNPSQISQHQLFWRSSPLLLPFSAGGIAGLAATNTSGNTGENVNSQPPTSLRGKGG